VKTQKNNIIIEQIKTALIIKPELAMRLDTEKSNIEDLAKSIDKVGLINPLTLKKIGNYYEIVAGFRRYLACAKLGWSEVPAVVLEENSEIAVGVMTAENYEREEVNVFDESIYLHKLIETTKMSQKSISKEINRSESYVSERLQIMNYPDELRDALYQDTISFSVARELNKIGNEDDKIMYVRYAIQNGCTPDIARNWRKQLELQGKQKAEDILTVASENYNQNSGSATVMMPCRVCMENIDVVELVTMYVCKTCLSVIKKVTAM
jgi:ParB family chromosome partitioning protein